MNLICVSECSQHFLSARSNQCIWSYTQCEFLNCCNNAQSSIILEISKNVCYFLSLNVCPITALLWWSMCAILVLFPMIQLDLKKSIVQTGRWLESIANISLSEYGTIFTNQVSLQKIAGVRKIPLENQLHCPNCNTLGFTLIELRPCSVLETGEAKSWIILRRQKH